jgi:hypothetical protein
MLGLRTSAPLAAMQCKAQGRAKTKIIMGRKKKVLTLTKEQIDFRNSILRGKINRVKNAEKNPGQPEPNQEKEFVLTKDDEIRKCFFYLNNCVFWLNEYIDGKGDKARLLETAIAIQHNAVKLEELLK